MDLTIKMLLYMVYLVSFQTVFSQLLSESSISRILRRLDRLEDDSLVIRKTLKEENDLFREDIFTLSNELRNVRKDLHDDRELRRADISHRLKESSGQNFRQDNEYVALAQQGSCDCDAIVSQYKTVLNAFKSEKAANIMLRKEFDEMRKEHDLEIGNVSEMFNNVVSRLNSTDRTLRSDIDAIKTETKQNFGAAQKLVHDSYAVCQKEINQTRAYFNDGFMRVNESLTNLSLYAQHEISRITTDIVNLKTSNEILKTVTHSLINHPNSCDFVEKSGEYIIYPSSHPNGIRVYCYKDSTNKGWIVIQRRADGSVDFNRNWADYKAGFGNLSGEFWLGNEHIYQLTKDEPKELRIDMEMFNGTKRYALYSTFRISSEAEKYKLHVAGCSGDAGDGLAKIGGVYVTHNGQSFSTFDADNDLSKHGCCACEYVSGWWFGYCFSVNLNGKYNKENIKVAGDGIIWSLLTGFNKSLKFVTMNIR